MRPIRHASDTLHGWARQLTVGDARAKSILLALCLYADHELRCWPSLGTLALDTEQSETTVRGRLRYLEEIGVIVRLARWIDDDGRRNTEGHGRRTTDEIQLLPSATQETIDAALAARKAGPSRHEGLTESASEDAENIEQLDTVSVSPARHEGQAENVNPAPPEGGRFDSAHPLNSYLNQEPTPKPPSVPVGAPAAIQSPRPAPAEAPQAGIQGEQAAGPPSEPPGLDRLIRGFANPALVNRAKTLREFVNLTESEQHKAEDIAPRYAADMRRLRKTPKRLHLWVRDRDFANYVGSTGALRFVPAKEPGGAAVRVLAALLGNITVPSHWCGRDEAGGAFGYWIWFEIEPRFLGLAAAAVGANRLPDRQRWPEFRVGSQHHGAWQSFIDAAMGPERRKHLPVERGVIRAPWPFPPLVDGSLSDRPPGSPSSTGPPLPEISEEDAAAFADGIG